MLKSIIGTEGFIQASSQNPDLLSQVQKKIADIERASYK